MTFGTGAVRKSQIICVQTNQGKGKTMSRILTLIYVIWAVILSSTPVWADDPRASNVERTHVDAFDASRQRPVKMTIWYPRAESAACEATLCLAEDVKRLRTAVISHGAMGSAMEYNWVGYALASQGIVTVGISHYGESWIYGQEHVDFMSALKIWQRPADVSFALDALEKNSLSENSELPLFNLDLSWQNTLVVGHSSGGSTALALAGGRYNPARALDYCENVEATQDRSCVYLKYWQPDASYEQHVAGDFTDPRVTKIVLLDPALGHLTDLKSLEQMKVPALIIGSQNNDFLDYQHHGAFYAKTLDHAHHVALTGDEGHFIYLDSCDHEYDALGVSLCKDREGVDRGAVQKSLYKHIFSFIYAG